MMQRARRRSDLKKMKARARKLYPNNDCPEKFANHLAVCSCHGCGNPRKHFKEVTRKEKIQENIER